MAIPMMQISPNLRAVSLAYPSQNSCSISPLSVPLSHTLMEGETSKGAEIKAKTVAAEAVEPISVHRCCSHEPDHDQSSERISRYNECRHNHTASFGRYVFDGCGEFIRCKDDVYTCAACGCHRSFHRKGPPNIYNNVAVAPPLAPLPLAAHNGLTGETSLLIKDRNVEPASDTQIGVVVGEEKKTKKKRAKRTVLTTEHKNKLTEFAEKLGWKPQMHDGAEIQRFCEELGITKRVFTVWLNNHRRKKGPM
ncbi:hypothetical protein PTKIN_Ptkin02bG0242100 [Pterospermum kingtungense]